MTEPRIYCLKCCSMQKVEEVYKNALIVTPILEIDADGDLEYDRENAVIEEGEVDHYQCAACGTPFKDQNGHVVDTCDGLAALAAAGVPSIDYPSIFEFLKDMQETLSLLQHCKEAAADEAKHYYMDARAALIDAKDRHVKAIKEQLHQLDNRIALEKDRHVRAGYITERERLDSVLAEFID